MKKNTTRYEEVPLSKIKVGVRRRVNMGDIPGLAASMEHIGLQHPIRLDADYVLIVGARRLAAARLLAWKTIPATIYHKAIPPDMLRVIELAEDKQRKDFEAFEVARTLVELAEEAAAELRQEAQGNLLTHSGSSKPDNESAVVARLAEKGVKVSKTSLQRKKKRVEEVERDPSLMDKSQGAALKAADEREGKVAVAQTDDLGITISQAARSKLTDIMRSDGHKSETIAVEILIAVRHGALRLDKPPKHTGQQPTKLRCHYCNATEDYNEAKEGRACMRSVGSNKAACRGRMKAA